MSAAAARPAITRMVALIDREAANVKSPCSKTKRGYLKRISNSQPMGASVPQSAHSTLTLLSLDSRKGQAVGGCRARLQARQRQPRKHENTKKNIKTSGPQGPRCGPKGPHY